MSKKDKSLLKYNSKELGLIGLETEFKLCHIPFLVADDVFGVVALQGSSGTGKTTMVGRIGKLNELSGGGSVGVFSADKARYEDFIGCPIPDQKTHQMKMYPMPNSVARTQTVLVDEINRASYENQEKWLSLFASRTIDGMPVACRYIFAAMNPILSEGSSDVYEGVQPLDKALGERMMALIDIPSFNKLQPADRLRIMTSAFNQVDWAPSDELVEGHKAYIQRAKEHYTEYKELAMDKIADYLDAVISDIRKETQGAISVEARRAQYMLTNILSVHALDSVHNTANLTTSALSALLISFPNPLWEQPIQKEALKQAHNKSSALLTLSAKGRKKSASNFHDLSSALKDVVDSANKKVDKEQVSKLINNNLPSKTDDPINHYVYAIGVVKGLTMTSTSKSDKQGVMKEQEFSRFEKIFTEITESKSYKSYSALGDDIIKGKDLPADFKAPEFIDNDPDEESINILKELLKIDIGQYALSVAEVEGVEVNNTAELLMILDKITDTLNDFKTVKEIYNP